MADNSNYNTITGKDAFYSRKEIAWHEKGQISEGFLTSGEVLVEAQLHFPVELRPNVHRLDNGTEIISKNSFFTYRTDTGDVLGDKIGKDYHVVQNVDAFTFFDSIVGGDGGIMYETAGALGKGERIFITAKLPGYIRVGSDDLIDKYLFLTTSHDGSGCIFVGFTPIRIVCNNTLNAALKNCTNTLKIRHTAGAEERLQQAHKVMGMCNTMTDELNAIFNQMAKVRITDRDVRRLIELALAPNKEVLDKLKAGDYKELSTRFVNTVDLAYEYAMSNASQQFDTTKGTVFGAYNAVTGYFQNIRDYKSNDAKMDAIFYGGIAQQKTQIAFDLCEAYMKKGSDGLILN
jgi:phage/plasmid-like protein (TIGR03299 family)